MCRALAIVLVLAAASPASAEDRRGLKEFEKQVRPLLVRRCYPCHSNQSKPLRGGLRLDTREGWRTGGERGPAVIPGRPDQSLLVQAVRYGDKTLQMPPKQKLSRAEIAILVRWVRIGAPDPRKAAPGPPTNRGPHWAFRPLAAPRIPALDNDDWSSTPVDRFILARLQESGLRPSAEADRRTLIRRVTFDLTGLPPTPGEVAHFLADTTPAAWTRIVDRLLASPHYGQRWGRHWLDVARYADSNGLDENVAHGNAWRYRDYVVDAFNADLPFDRFLLEQLAGDLLPIDQGDTAARRSRLIATGFLSLGPKVLAEVDERKMEMDIVDEQVDTLGRALLGLTFGCARCHDHKFDPFSTRDYYALAGVFKSTRTMEHFKKVARWWENPIATPEEQTLIDQHRGRVKRQKAVIDRLAKQALKALGQDPNQGEITSQEKKFPAATRKKLEELRQELASLEKAAPQLSTAMGVTEGDVVNVKVHIRGSHLELGEMIPRGVPGVLTGGRPVAFPEKHSGRLELAHWLTRSDHPLTARVFVNRLWRWHFGRGLVASTDNFGRLGTPPTHPALLDWLASEFIEGRWSTKRLQRTILLSRTYRLQSVPRDDAVAVDPENRLWWRSPLRRLEAEALRDAMLAVSGTLDTALGGSLLHVDNRAYFFDHTSKDQTRYNVPRRSLYLPVVRNHLYDVFTLFDYTDASVLNGNRATTTVAPQALFLLNSSLVESSSRQIATRLLALPATDNAERIDRLYERVLSRPASRLEIRLAETFLDSVTPSLPVKSVTRVDRWQALCHVLLASNEFIYLR